MAFNPNFNIVADPALTTSARLCGQSGSQQDFSVVKVLVSWAVRQQLTPARIASLLRRHQRRDWGIAYKLEWDEDNDTRLEYGGAVRSCFLVGRQRRRLLVKTSANRRRTILRFDDERIETRRFEAALVAGHSTLCFRGP